MLEEVKCALGNISMSKASGGDGIPVELFQILKKRYCESVALNMPANLENSAVATGVVKDISTPKKGKAKECSYYHMMALILHGSKTMLQILQARLQQYVIHELLDVQAGFRKGRGTKDQISTIHWIIKKVREFQKNIYFCVIDYAKAIDCGSQQTVENS